MNVDVFLSYARVDQEVVNRVAASLAEVGIDVWWDALLQPGENFDQRIQEVIGSAKVIVGVLSPGSLSSDWVRWELSQAVAGDLHVIPILVGGVQPEDLAPPLSLIHSLVVSDDTQEALDECAVRVRGVVQTLGQRITSGDNYSRDARRRLTQAATDTACRAREIKDKNRGTQHSNQAGSGGERGSYTASSGLPDLLQKKGISLAVTSPDAGMLYLIGCDTDGRLAFNETRFDEPSGLCVEGDSLIVATHTSLVRLENILRPGQTYDGKYSHCFVTRTSHFLGDLALHDVRMAKGKNAIFVSSRYSCIARVSAVHSFQMVWKPNFVTEIVPEDRCHLNGLAIAHGQLAYATAFGETNTIDGWRKGVRSGGVVLSAQTGDVVCTNLTMPHSPHFHDGRLWLLNSGTGELGMLSNLDKGFSTFQPVASLPGFTRGLSFCDDLAFVGLSLPRYTNFEGLDINDRLQQDGVDPKVGVAVVDLASGRCIEWFWLTGDEREVYDVVVLAGVDCPVAYSPQSQQSLGLVTMHS